MARPYNITKKQWAKYVDTLKRLQDRAANEMLAFMNLPQIKRLEGADYSQALIDYGYALATKYGEGATAVAATWYDAIAAAEAMDLLPAVPADTATIEETAKVVNGTLKTGNPNIISEAIGRLVKQAGADTTLQNAVRDGAYFAWVSSGDTCAYCLALAGLGWQKAGKHTVNGKHADHIHANCDCAYVIDFNGGMKVAGYDPDGISRMISTMTDGLYDAEDLIKASGHGRQNYEGLNMIRRKFYADNKELINEQKRSAYTKRLERNSSAAEEIIVD